MDRDDALEAFLAVVNLCEPDHPYSDSCYPLSAENVDYGSCRSYWARCGPQYGWGEVYATYMTRMTYINKISRARHLALLVHEISHIPETPEREHGSHPPAFWREMAFNALLVRDSIREREDGALWEAFGDVSEDRFLREVIRDPNNSTVDLRRSSVDDVRATVAELVGRPDLL
jgi:hypothetical protein